MDDPWFRASMERIADLVVAIDHTGLVVYANPATNALLGITPDELIGRNCLEFVHPDDLERAVGTIGYGVRSDRAEVPVTFRLLRGETWMTFEVRGHGLGTDPSGETMLLVCRETNNTELLDELLDVLATGAEFRRALELIALQLVRDLWTNVVAVLYHDGDELGIAHTGFPDEVLELLRRDVDTPWGDAKRDRSDVFVQDIDQLPVDVAAPLQRAGYRAVFAVPIDDPRNPEPVVVVLCSATWSTPDLGLGVALDRTRRLLRLALQQRSATALLEQSARTDFLTGISNRRRFFARLEEEIASLDGREVAVAFVDLDRFKAINDTYGHAAGDRVLQTIATRLSETVGDRGMVARIGGDEFALLIVDGAAPAITDDAVRAASLPIEFEGQTLSVGASAGIAIATPGEDPAAVLDRADALSYAAKRRHD